MEIIQEVGSYAGFAAVVGLAVLSALYFSQARDLRRLREWAGRAPERTAGQAAAPAAAPEQAAQEAVRPAPTGAVRPIPAAKPAAPGAKPQPGAPAAPPAGKLAGAKPAEGPKESPTAAPPVPAIAATANADQVAARGPAPATPAAAPGKPPGAAPPKPPAVPAPAPGRPPPAVPRRPPAVPARPGPVARSPAAAAASQSTAVLPPSARVRGRTRDDEGNVFSRLGGRYIALIVAGVIVLGGAAAFGISQIGGDDATAPGDRAAGGDEAEAPVNPSTVTVSVLNGTTVPGLAAQIGDEVESAGFQRGNVANALDQQRTTSVVLYAEDAEREARLVARRLGIREVDLIDPDSQALAGNASVVVIVGADQTQ